MLTWTADRYPDRRAVGGPRPLTWRQWDARTNRLARALAGLGVRPGDRVAFLLAGGEPMASLHLAVQKLGAATVPLSIRFGPAELAYCVSDADPRMVIGDDTTSASLAALTGGPPVRAQEELDELAQREPDGELTANASTKPEDLSVILYTSGTTGRPKGVPRTHRAEHAAAVAHVIQTQHRPGEVTLGVMPLFHTMGVRTLLASILVAGTWVPQARFDAEESLELITTSKISALYLVPTIYWSLLRTGRLAQAGTVKRVAYAGAPMTPALAAQLDDALHPEVFVNHFGSTEIYTFTIGPQASKKPGCAGRAGVFSRVRLVDPLDPATVVPDRTQGQVAVSMTSPEAFAGYRNRPDADARAIRDGWYLTGDLATEDDDGDLWVSGRVDDMINSGGENLYPDEIEAALARCPAVSAVVVVGLPDDRWGQAVTAFVVPAQDFLPNGPRFNCRNMCETDPGCRRSSGPSVTSQWTASPPRRSARSCAASSPKAATTRSPRSTHDGRPGRRRPLARVEDPALLCGQGKFLDDLDPLPGTLTAAIVRSPFPHARITGFDSSAALASPGVTAVIGPPQIAELGPFPLSVRTPMPYFAGATDRVRFVGEPVAVVVAADRYLAEDAAELVDVDYEELPVVTGTAQALAAEAPRLHPEAESNVATDRTFSFGPVDEAFAEADHVVSGDYSFPRYSSMPMECYCVVANWTETAEGPAVEAWANFHGPFSMIPVLAASLGVPAARLRLHVPADIGGSFGIKAGIYPYVTLMALASKHARRPVRWTEDRLEHLVASSAGADRLMRFDAAVTVDGTVTALRTNLVDNVGAYLRPPEPSTLYRCFGNITGAYRIPAVRIRARAVVTNKTPTGLNRGFGGQQLYFGLERLMDKVAAVTGLDPAEARRRNFIGAGEFPYRTPTGGVYDSGDYRQAFDLALKNADYDALRADQEAARSRGEYFGIGLAAVVDPSATNIGYVGLATPASQRAAGRGKSGSTELVRISVDPGGVVSVLLGTVPQGQGHATVARQVVADRLGLPPEQVRPVVEMDTATTPWTITSGSYSSRFAPLLTSALAEAADQIAATIRVAGAVLLEADPDEVELAGGLVRHKNDHEQSVTFRHAAGLVHWDPGSLPGPLNLYAAAAFTPPQAVAAAADDTINSSLCYGFVADVAAVRIDPLTLQVSIEKLATVHDAGTVLNPALLDGQVHGAIAHALGGAFYEEMVYSEDGQPASGTFMDYLCPTSAEATFPLSSDHIQTPSPYTRLGAKGCGEGSSMSVPVALANAVADALAPHGIDLTSLPVHGNVLHALIEGEP